MGREIRRVPEGWEHPRELQPRYKNDYVPLYDEPFESAAKEWLDGLDLWLKGENESQDITAEEIANLNNKYGEWSAEMFNSTITAYAEYIGDFPDRSYYRPDWSDEERTHFQMYETVSEGTPVSPVFASKEGLADWLVESEGYTRKVADKFIEVGSVPSFMIVPQADGSSTLFANLECLGD